MKYSVWLTTLLVIVHVRVSSPFLLSHRASVSVVEQNYKHSRRKELKRNMFVESMNEILKVSINEELKTAVDAIYSSLQSIPNNPETESVVLKDLGRLASLPIFTEELSLLRLKEVIGQVLGISSKFVAGGTLQLDDVFYQTSIFGVSLRLFLKSALPVVKAYFVDICPNDEKAFNSVFKPSGFTWMQYKALKAEKVIDWIEVEPFAILTTENNSERNQKYDDGDNDVMFWLLRGSFQTSFGCNSFHFEDTAGKSIDNPKTCGLIGDMRFLYELNKQETRTELSLDELQLQQQCTDYQSEINECSIMPKTKIGKNGATVLRIRGSKMLTLMEDDKELLKSFKFLLLKSLQRKVVMSIKLLNTCGSNAAKTLS